MKCYKCGGKIAVIIKDHYMQPKEGFVIGGDCIHISNTCLPCIYEEYDNDEARDIMPFTKRSLEKIRNGKKWTSLRSLKYDKYPFDKSKVRIGVDLYVFNDFLVMEKLLNNMSYEDIMNGKCSLPLAEGFNTYKELITAIKKMRHKLPKEMWLYDLRKPIN